MCKMTSLRCSYVLAVLLFQNIASQEIPEECQRPPPPVKNPLECCAIPQFFKDSDFEECGFRKREGMSQDPPPQGPPPHGPPPPGFPPAGQTQPCPREVCLMNKYNLTGEDSTLDKEAVSRYMEEYTKANPNFENAVAQAKNVCLDGNSSNFGPPQICSAVKLMMCLSATLLAECPAWSDSQECSSMKEHMNKCKHYLFKF